MPNRIRFSSIRALTRNYSSSLVSQTSENSPFVNTQQTRRVKKTGGTKLCMHAHLLRDLLHTSSSSSKNAGEGCWEAFFRLYFCFLPLLLFFFSGSLFVSLKENEICGFKTRSVLHRVIRAYYAVWIIQWKSFSVETFKAGFSLQFFPARRDGGQIKTKNEKEKRLSEENVAVRVWLSTFTFRLVALVHDT